MSRIDVVTHVHWDREWYRTFDGFRSRLVELVDAVLDQLESGQLESFLLDGQTSIVDDHLEVRPDARDRIAAHVAAGRLRIGPWFVLADKTLVSFEALVRNLLHGARRATELGGRTDVGYCPDMFGHPPELPLVLRGFGIEVALVWRGADPDVPVFRWRSADGSEVLTLRSRYYEPEILWTRDDADERLGAWLDARRATQPDGPWLLLNGGDHLAPRDLAATLAAVRVPGDTEVVLRQTTLEEHLASLAGARDGADAAAVPVVDGALRRPGVGGAFLLAGTLSTRARQKRLHAAAQVLLETVAEPLASQALWTDEPVGAAEELPNDATVRGLLDLAWRHLLLSQPHDSVCGCGTDTVAADTTRRLEAAIEVGEQVAARAAARLGLPIGVPPEPDLDTCHLGVLNPLGADRGGLVHARLAVPAGRRPRRIVAPDGTEVPFVAQLGAAREDLVTDIATLPVWPSLADATLSVVVPPVPASGWSALTVELEDADADGRAAGRWETDEPVEPGASITSGGDPAELTVELASDGTLVVSRASTGVRVEGVGRLVDTGDRGDLYNHDAPLDDRTVVPALRGARRRRDPLGEQLEVHLAASLPTGLVGDARDARADETTPLRAVLTATLLVGADQVELSLVVDTDAEGHRLRLHVPVPGAPEVFTTDGGLTWQDHEVPPVAPPPLPEATGEEADPRTQPMHRFVAAGAGDERVAVLVRGSHEAAAERTDAGVELAVTLVRAVGQLGQHDLRTRTMGAGPPVPTPAAQEPGRHEIDLALRLGDDDAQLTAAAWAWRAPLVARGLRASPDEREHRGVEVTGAQLSAWKPAEADDAAVLRIVNPLPTPTTATLRLPWDAELTPSRLDETAVADPVEARLGDPVTVELPPSGTATWRVRPR